MKILGITMGDACGIGPEIILEACRQPLPDDVLPVVYGSAAVLEREAKNLASKKGRARGEEIVAIDALASAKKGRLNVLEVEPDVDFSGLGWGVQDPRAARLQLTALERAIEDAREEKILAIATAPWTKELFSLIEAPTVGHTEVLARAFDAPHHVMMLAGDRLRVALTTVHVPVRRVSEVLTAARLSDTIRTTCHELRRLYGVEVARIAVCGLNPHAGEHGVMGTEEDDVIRPVIASMRSELGGVCTLEGPFPSDTLFAKFRDAQPYDAVICMYHDQGLIPLKLLHFGQSANITLGLPIVRTSVDHGTAYDIAGQGIAKYESMRYAMELALELSQRASQHRRTY
jgi:4-hydroxythreonine-4-phosphate dehydrogenase